MLLAMGCTGLQLHAASCFGVGSAVWSYNWMLSGQSHPHHLCGGRQHLEFQEWSLVDAHRKGEAWHGCCDSGQVSAFADRQEGLGAGPLRGGFTTLHRAPVSDVRELWIWRYLTVVWLWGVLLVSGMGVVNVAPRSMTCTLLLRE